MPVTRCVSDGLPGFRWGTEGKCYTYDPRAKNADAQRTAARNRALAQGRAVEASKARATAGKGW